MPEFFGVYYRWKPFYWRVTQEVQGVIVGHSDAEVDLDVVARTYAARLRDEIQPGLRTTEATTHPRRGDETGGPGIDMDYVALGVVLTAGASAYVVWKEVAADLRETVRRLRRLCDDRRVEVDEGAALILAWDAVAGPNDPDLRLRFIAPLKGQPEPFGQGRGFLVAFEHDDGTTIVVVDPHGEVVGRTDEDVPGLDFGRLGL
jgi:hypothetical protein